MRRRLVRPGLIALAALVPASLAAQSASELRALETRTLREVSALENQGMREEAERRLTNFLDGAPTSSGALFALERILRSGGRLEELLPRIGAALRESPRGVALQGLRLRVLEELDAPEAVEEAIGAWIGVDPSASDPWREGARVLERVRGRAAARALLERGVERAEPSASLLLDLGDLHLRGADTLTAVRQWVRAVGAEPLHFPSVLRRVAAVDGPSGVGWGRVLFETFSATDSEDGLRFALRLAVERGLEEEADRALRGLFPRLESGERAEFLLRLAQSLESSSLRNLERSVLELLRREPLDPEMSRALDARIGLLALQAGDSAVAREARWRESERLPRGSEARRRILLEHAELEQGSLDDEALLARVREFRAEFPGPPSMGPLVARRARLRMRDGAWDAAARLLAEVEGPEAALEQGYLWMGRDSLDQARTTFLSALPDLSPATGTALLELLSVLDEVGPEAARDVARASVLAHLGRLEEALELLAELPGERSEAERLTIWTFAAHLADAGGLPEQAASLRERIVAGAPGAPEAVAATISLARWLARTPDGAERAGALLENVIIAQPFAPLVPDARRELARIRTSRGGGPTP